MPWAGRREGYRSFWRCDVGLALPRDVRINVVMSTAPASLHVHPATRGSRIAMDVVLELQGQSCASGPDASDR
jgi:hypothetical protein